MEEFVVHMGPLRSSLNDTVLNCRLIYYHLHPFWLPKVTSKRPDFGFETQWSFMTVYEVIDLNHPDKQRAQLIKSMPSKLTKEIRYYQAPV